MNKSRLGLSMFLIGLLYCALLALGNLFIHEQQKNSFFSELETRQMTEIRILSELTREGLITQNYAFIESLFNRWGSEFLDVVSLKLENTQGYALISYQRSLDPQADMLVSSNRIAMHDGIYMLRISTDTVEIQRRLDELLLQLFLISTGATALLIILLWLVLVKFAVQPLSAEIKRRKKVEDQLLALQTEE